MGEADAQSGRRAFSNNPTFIGIADLVPIYDAFEDGAEMLWRELDDEAPGNAESLVYSEHELAAIYESLD